MRTKGGVILITLLLIVSVNAQKQEISGLKTQTITLSRKAPKDKTDPPRFWILVNSEINQVMPVEPEGSLSRMETPVRDVAEASSGATHVGQIQNVNLPKRRYSIAYEAFSLRSDDLWLHLEATPAGGTGLVKDMGEMKWEEVDRMPPLFLKRITSGVSISMNHGTKSVGPQGLIVRAVAGHIYAAQIKDDHTDYRVIFRIDSIDSNGECNISWKRVPSK